MIIKKITLNNIRSYEHEEVELTKGSTLLSGDIGSGKTSVLLAIEFGLFGLQPGQRGSLLLRNGKNEGSVILEFEVDGKNVVVERKLKKGKSISQDYAAITIDGKKEELSVTELKQKILHLLNYPQEFSKKQNLLYKFTVYTPQEEMKGIVLEDPEVRINTLRHVFGIDKYKTILENTSILRLKLREEKRMMEGITSTLEEEKLNLKEKEILLKEKEESIENLELEFFEKKQSRKRKEEEKQEISKKIEDKNSTKEEISKSKIMFLSKKENLLKLEEQIIKLNKDIENFKNQQVDEISFEDFEKNFLQMKREKEKLEEKRSEILSEVVNLTRIIEEKQKISETFSDLKVCPTCQQDVDAVYRANVLNLNYNEISQSKKRIEELEIQKKEVYEKIKELERKFVVAEKKLLELKLLRMRKEEIQEKVKNLEGLNKNKELLEKDLILLKKHLDSLNEVLFNLSRYDSILSQKELELKEALRNEKISEIKLAEVKKEIEIRSKSLLELKERINKIEEVKEKLNYITTLENWLNKNFVSVVSFLEKNVMNSLKQEFSKLFSEWFKTLVSDTLEVRLSDDFTPIIEQQDYELDYAYLSGGERTAIALAYRLALNQIINSLVSKIKTKELIILDEPTDGFSEQQLDKMRSVLEQLKVQQLIIVSHEQKIEGFVENVIRFRKNHGISGKED